MTSAPEPYARPVRRPHSPPVGPHGRAWRALGTAGRTAPRASRAARLDLPFVRSRRRRRSGTHRRRPLVVVRPGLPDRLRRGGRRGGASVPALADTTYDAEDADAAWSALRTRCCPALAGRWPTPRGLAAGRRPGRRRPPGRPAAGLVGPRDGRGRCPPAGGRPVARRPARRRRPSGSRPGAVLGLPTRSDALARRPRATRTSGYARAKVKVAPGDEHVIVDVLSAPIRRSSRSRWTPTAPTTRRTLDGLATLDRLGLLCIEQPLDRETSTAHRAPAVGGSTTPVCLDE